MLLFVRMFVGSIRNKYKVIPTTMKQKFTYSDSEAGEQTQVFSSLSSIVSFIEGFGYNGDSDGIVYANSGGEDDEEAVLVYKSRESGLTWECAR